MSGSCATCSPRSAQPARTPRTCGWCRSPPLRAIREELDRGPAHVLHIYRARLPRQLDLEDDDGTARPVTAERVPGAGGPARDDAAGDHLVGLLYRRAAQPGRGLVRGRLCQHGAAAVIATETSVTDIYATRLLARVYGTLARPATPT